MQRLIPHSASESGRRLIIGDEPAVVERLERPSALGNSVTTSLGKEGADARLFLIGTRYPCRPVRTGGSRPSTRGDTAIPARLLHNRRREEMGLSGPRSCGAIRWPEQVGRIHRAAKGRVGRREEVRAVARFTFQRIRLNARMHGRTPDSVLLQPSQVDKLLARRPAPREGACIVSVDMAGATGWSGATAVWGSGRMECFAVCPQTAEAMEVQDGRDSGDYRALVDAGVLVESGVTMPAIDLIEAEIRSRWPEAICIVADLYRLPQLQNVFDGELPVHLRPWRYAEQTADIATFRRLATDGPPLLTIADDGSRQLFAVSLSETVVEGDTSGNVRIGKMRGERRSRNDVVSAAVMATWGISTHRDMVERDDDSDSGDSETRAESSDTGDGIFF